MPRAAGRARLTGIPILEFFGMPASDGSAAGNDALVRAFLQAWERRDTEFIADCFTEDAVYHAVPLVPIAGRDAVVAWVRGFDDRPPGHIEVRHQVASDTLVMNERTDRITLNGRPVALPICAVFEVEHGRISAWREYFDVAPAAAAFADG
jgi:limonene-1,2-epoxide hydrolase